MDANAFLKHPKVQPIRPLLMDGAITEIMINGPQQVYVERGGVMEISGVRFRSVTELMDLIQAILEPSGREVSTASPYADFRLPDGTRGNVIIPPLALNGPVVTLRRATNVVKNVADLIAAGTISNRIGQLLIAAVQARANIVFAGATGTGKTTTLGIFAQYIPESERLITIEDTAELAPDAAARGAPGVPAGEPGGPRRGHAGAPGSQFATDAPDANHRR